MIRIISRITLVLLAVIAVLLALLQSFMLVYSQTPTSTPSPPASGFYIGEYVYSGSYQVTGNNQEVLLETIELDMDDYPITTTELVGYYVEVANASCTNNTCLVGIHNGTLTYDPGAEPGIFHTSSTRNPINPSQILYTQHQTCAGFDDTDGCPSAYNRYNTNGSGMDGTTIKVMMLS
jgi:hypothetical protein